MTEHAKDNAAACLADIVREAALLAAEPDTVTEDGQPVIEAWLERPLEALIRSDWHGAGDAGESTEYALLLTTLEERDALLTFANTFYFGA